MNKTKQSSIDAIKTAIEALNSKEIKSTQANVSKETNLSIRTIKRPWDRVTDYRVTTLPISNRVKVSTEQVNKVTDSFAKFKRRAEQSSIGIFKCSPDMF